MRSSSAEVSDDSLAYGDFHPNTRSDEREKRAVIAIDGKTMCGSANGEHRAVHVVSAWVVENQITLGQLATDEKSNEITAIPELLEMIDITGAIVTADAMSCQKKIVEKIIEKQADYVIGLKGNQGTLLEDASLYLTTEKEQVQRLDTPIEKGQGRIEKRSCSLATTLDWLPQIKEWQGLRGIGAAHSRVTEKGETREETRSFIKSLTDINEFAQSVRKHWSIQSMHWCLLVHLQGFLYTERYRSGHNEPDSKDCRLIYR